MFEKFVYNPFMFHFSFHSIISTKQSGFTPGSNTTEYLVDLIEEIKTIDSGEFAVMLF